MLLNADLLLSSSQLTSPLVFLPAVSRLEATRAAQNEVAGLEARLAALKEGVVDIHTTESAVERAQVSSADKGLVIHETPHLVESEKIKLNRTTCVFYFDSSDFCSQTNSSVSDYFRTQ